MAEPAHPMTVVAIGDPDRDDWAAVKGPLDAIGAQIKVVRARTEDELASQAHGAVGLMQGFIPYGPSLFDKLPTLKAIGANGIGVDSIDVDAATERGIIVFNLPGLIHREVAAHAFMFVLALARQLRPFDEGMRRGTRVSPPNPIPHLFETTLGLIAFGSIAREVAKYGHAAGMRVIAYDPVVDAATMEASGVTKVSLEDLLRQADFVSHHAPLNAQTFHMIGEPQLALMKPTAYFINTGRGKTVDEPALIRALQEQRIAGAGLDVLEQEPPAPDNPLLTMDNVLLTPHCASASANTRHERRQRQCEEMARVLSGHWPKYGLVNKELRSRLNLAD